MSTVWTACTPMSPGRRMIYSVLADYYDALVGDPEAFEAWTDWIESHHPGPQVLELACGSGEITRRLADAGFEVTGMDLSEEMLKRAREKSAKVSFQAGDMRDLSAFETYDLILCLCDSINYLESEAEFSALLDEVKAHLKPGGLFLFDMHTPDRLEEFADEYIETGAFEDGTQVQWIISAEDGVIYQDFAFYTDQGLIEEHHRQVVFDPDFVQAELEKRFVLLDVRTDFEKEGQQEGEKLFYAARKGNEPC